jgi:hypothetical protein
MVRVGRDAIQVDFDQGKARMQVQGLQVYDDHDIFNSLTFGLGFPGDLGTALPVIPPVAPVLATASFDVRWNDPIETAEIRNTVQGFKGKFLSTHATIEWSAEEPGFHYQSDTPPKSGANLISVLGREQNGVFFT